MTWVWLELWGLKNFHRTWFTLLVFSLVVSVAIFTAVLVDDRRVRFSSGIVLAAVAWIVTGLLYGTHATTWACGGFAKLPTFEHRVMTVDLPRNSQRLMNLESRFRNSHGISTIRKTYGEVVYGGTLGDRRTAQLKSYAASLRDFLENRNEDADADATWVVIYEDDAFPLGGVRYTAFLEDAVCRYGAEYDAVWLDTGSIDTWLLSGTVLTGTNAIAWKKSILRDLMPVMDARIKSAPENTDSFFPRMCRDGKIKCAMSPLVSATNDASTIEGR